MTASNLTPTRSESNHKALLLPEDFCTRAGISRSTMFELIRKGELRAQYTETGCRLLLGFEPTELQKYPEAFQKWLLQRQPARAREEQKESADLAELGDALPELVYLCARLKAVDGREKTSTRPALAQELGISEPTLNVWIRKARKGPAALKRQMRSDKGKVRGPGDLIAKYGKEKVQEWLRLIDAYLRLQLMDGRGLSLRRRLKDARKECLRLNIDPALLNYARVKRIKNSIGGATQAFFGPQKQRHIDQHQPHVLVEKPAILHTC